jgi:hypothetical protein
MSNEIIGIVGVFAFTFFLFVLRHFYLSIGRTNKSRHVTPTTPPGHYELSTKAVEDDSWLLWSPDNEAGSPNRVDEATKAAREPRDEGRTLLRLIAGR